MEINWIGVIFMGANMVNLNVNPCKMCMPLGVVSAFYGVQKCMTILHGSQGCSTYIRRHMATHYNEPVDIASSSLTEEGTVYGGEKNLIIGIENLIKLYSPDVIGVGTTCLAETIGEDIPRIIKDFYDTHPNETVKIIPVQSAGYGGTQYEGFIKALLAIVSNIEMDSAKNDKINVITSMLSPADTRYLKDLLEHFGIDYILLPDISENLDGVHKEHYDRLISGGTPISEISKMAGATATIEISAFTNSENSPAQYLFDTYGVPYTRLNIPMGLRDTDALIKELARLTDKEIPEMIAKQRGRYLDAMIDSHKYNAEGKAVIFGEPDFVYSATRLCCENGIMPVVVATGSKCPYLQDILYNEIKAVADALFINKFEILDDTDFDTIEKYAVSLHANVMLGSSDARRIESKHNISLVRCAFPIHDQMGEQRVQTIGYEGSLNLLDKITNSIITRKDGTFRERIYNEFYKEGQKTKYGLEKEEEPKDMVQIIAEKTATHPCYSCSAGEHARMHLPVAPKCNISCNYCLRKYDCPNESRPGVTTDVLTPQQAFDKYMIVKAKVPNLSVVGIAGPGDSLADWENTKKALEMIKEEDPNITFCLSTNGLMLPYYAEDLINLGVTHITITVNAVDPVIGAKIYKYIDFMGKRYTGEVGASILLANQIAGIKMLTVKGIMCKINTVALKGINDEHIEEVVKTVKGLGCFISNIMPLIPVKGSVFENVPPASNKELNLIRKKCGEHLKQMYHCKQCRADAIGKIDSDVSIEFRGCGNKKTEGKPLRFAAVSKGGMLIDQHFGYASELYIYDYKNGEVAFSEKRTVSKYCTGVEGCDDKEDKIDQILSAVNDCDMVLAMRIGESPTKKLEQKGIKVFTTYDRIEDAVRLAAKELINI